MSNDAETFEHPRRRWARIAFLLLVIIPFLPEILILITTAAAHLKGCHPDQKEACLIGTLPVSDIISFALRAGVGLITAAVRDSFVWFAAQGVAIAGWIVACYVLLTRGWSRLPSRLSLGFAVALVYSFLPYFGPMLAIASLANDNCRPNEGGVGACMIFGGYVGSREYSPAHDAVALGWLAPFGALLALGIFVIYAIAVISMAIASARRTTKSA